jgi:hypothetical protein
MMRNEALERLDGIVDRWTLTLSDAWFLEPPGTEQHGWATIEWLDDAFLVLRSGMEDRPLWDMVFGHSDARDAYEVLYHDERGTSRVFAMTFADGQWTMSREDPDFHQRFVARVEGDRILGHWDASDDGGATWRKDFDITFDRESKGA